MLVTSLMSAVKSMRSSSINHPNCCLIAASIHHLDFTRIKLASPGLKAIGSGRNWVPFGGICTKSNWFPMETKNEIIPRNNSRKWLLNYIFCWDHNSPLSDCSEINTSFSFVQFVIISNTWCSRVRNCFWNFNKISADSFDTVDTPLWNSHFTSPCECWGKRARHLAHGLRIVQWHIWVEFRFPRKCFVFKINFTFQYSVKWCRIRMMQNPHADDQDPNAECETR